MLKGLRYVAIGVAAVAAGALVLSFLVEEDEEEPAATEAPKQITALSKPLQAKAIEAASEDATVRRVVGSTEVDPASRAVPWVAEGGTDLLGSLVHLRLRQPLTMDEAKLPVYLTPNEGAPASLPDLRRFVLYSGTGITELGVLLSLPDGEVLEIVPEGKGASVEPPRLIGPPPSNDYRGSGGK